MRYLVKGTFAGGELHRCRHYTSFLSAFRDAVAPMLVKCTGYITKSTTPGPM